MQKHQWREGSDDEQLFFRATFHAGIWKLYTQTNDDDQWVQHDPIPEEYLKKLREVIWNKYQRGRCPYKLVVKIDKMLEKGV